MAGRVSQKTVEVLYSGTPNARVSQEAVEALYAPSDRRARVSQVVVEVLYRILEPGLLGPAQLFSPTISQASEVAPGVLGPAQLFTPEVFDLAASGPHSTPDLSHQDRWNWPVWYQPEEISLSELAQFAGPLDLLGGGQLFSPTVGPAGVLPDLLGPAQLFTPFSQAIYPSAAQSAIGGSIADRLTARTHIWYQDDGWQGPFLTPEQFVALDLLGGAQLFSPLVGPPGVLPGLLGPAVLFAPTVVSTQTVGPLALLGPATLFAPTVSGFTLVTATFTADAVIELGVRLRHNRFTEHTGVDTDIAHLLAASITAYYPAGFPADELLREIDRRLTILETGTSPFRRIFGDFSADAIVKKNTEFTITADAVIVFGVGPMPRLGGAILSTPTVTQ